MDTTERLIAELNQFLFEEGCTLRIRTEGSSTFLGNSRLEIQVRISDIVRQHTNSLTAPKSNADTLRAEVTKLCEQYRSKTDPTGRKGALVATVFHAIFELGIYSNSKNINGITVAVTPNTINPDLREKIDYQEISLHIALATIDLWG